MYSIVLYCIVDSVMRYGAEWCGLYTCNYFKTKVVSWIGTYTNAKRNYGFSKMKEYYIR